MFCQLCWTNEIPLLSSYESLWTATKKIARNSPWFEFKIVWNLANYIQTHTHWIFKFTLIKYSNSPHSDRKKISSQRTCTFMLQPHGEPIIPSLITNYDINHCSVKWWFRGFAIALKCDCHSKSSAVYDVTSKTPQLVKCPWQTRLFLQRWISLTVSRW